MTGVFLCYSLPGLVVSVDFDVVDALVVVGLGSHSSGSPRLEICIAMRDSSYTYIDKI